ARRHERGMGCGGRSSRRRASLFAGRLAVSGQQACKTNGESSVRQNRVVLASVADVKLPVARSIQPDRSAIKPAATVTKTNSSPGRARHKPSNHCAGNAGVFPLNLYARVRILCNFCTRDRGCSVHPAFPAPSFLRDNEKQASGKPCRENARARLELSSTLRAGANTGIPAEGDSDGRHSAPP